jgi:[ribosomal protein S5]-alanine N-acetyltransferase
MARAGACSVDGGVADIRTRVADRLRAQRVRAVADTLCRMLPFDQVKLRTPRLVLRPQQSDDAQSLFALFSDPVATRYLSRLRWSTIEQAHEALAKDAEARAAGQILRLAVELAGHPGLVGQVLLFNFERPSRRAEMGYILAPSLWGRGYMHEALHALVDFAFSTLELNRLEAEIDPRNIASARSLERLGFAKEGHLHERWIVNGEVSDTGLYGLLARQWAERLCAANAS